MGAKLVKLVKKIFDGFTMNSKVLLLGLDAAGKSTILYKLQLGEVVHTVPTIGFNVETVKYGRCSFNMWDVGGQDQIRPLWRYYFSGTQGLIFVVDSNDHDRIEEASEELHKLLSEDELRNAVLLVFANKQDLPQAMSIAQITEKLGLNHIRNRKWYVQGASAVTGDGLYEGLNWLATTVQTVQSDSAIKELMDKLAKLAESANQLASATTGSEFQLRRGTGQLSTEARRVLSSHSHPTQQQQQQQNITVANARAQLLLAQSRFDASKLNETLARIEEQASFRPQVSQIQSATAIPDEVMMLEEAGDVLLDQNNVLPNDVEGFLSYRHQEALVFAIEESKRLLSQSTNERFERALDDEWNRAKREILDSWTIPTATSSSTTSTSASFAASSPLRQTPQTNRSLQRSLVYSQIQTPLQQQQQQPQQLASESFGTEFGEERALRYASIVSEISRQKAEQEIPEAGAPKSKHWARKFLSSVNPQNQQDKFGKEAEGIWRAIDFMTQDAEMTGKNSLEFMINGSKNFLEELFKIYTSQRINDNLVKAAVGGTPNPRESARGLLRINFDFPTKKWPSNFELTINPSDNQQWPFWAELFFCLRCGEIQSARSLTSEILHQFDAILYNYLSNNRNLTDSILKRTANDEYFRLLKQSKPDPFKLACYGLVCRNDEFGDKLFNDVLLSSHDYLWYRLSVLPFNVSDDAFKTKLNSLQKEFVEMGNRIQSPLLYSQLLLLSLQPEKAIKNLWERRYRIDAMHYALCLSLCSGSLKLITNNNNSEMFSEDSVNLTRMLKQYSMKFVNIGDQRTAVQYICASNNEESIIESLRIVVLESRNLEMLLGERSGLLKELLPKRIWEKVASLTAIDCEQTGRQEEAVWLYKVIGNIDKVIEITGKQLGRLMSQTSESNEERKRASQRAYEILNKTSIVNIVKDNNKLVNFRLICALTDFFDVFHSGRYEEALRALENLRIVPLVDDVTLINQMADTLQRNFFSQELIQNFSQILIAAMTCIRKLWDILRSAPVGEQRNQSYLLRVGQLRKKAHALVMFAGVVQVRLPPTTMSYLVQEEVFMA